MAQGLPLLVDAFNEEITQVVILRSRDGNFLSFELTGGRPMDFSLMLDALELVFKP